MQKYVELDDVEETAQLLSGSSLRSNNNGDEAQFLANHKEITSLLKVLQKPWASENSLDEIGDILVPSLYLWKKRRNHPGWKKFYCSVQGNQLFFFKLKEDKKTAGRLNGTAAIAFLSENIALTNDELKSFESDPTQSVVSRHKLEIFTNNRVVSVCATSDEELQTFHDRVQKFLKENMSASEFKARTEAAQAILPLLKAKSDMDKEKIYQMLAVLEANGVFVGSSSVAKEKGGKLELEEEDTWTTYFFILRGGCLYFKKGSKEPPQGYILLKGATIDTPGDEPNTFTIETSVATFRLRAKHKEAMAEWLKVLGQSKDSSQSVAPKDNAETQFTNLLAESDGKRRILEYNSGSKQQRRTLPKQRFKFPKGACCVTIGRSSSNKLVIDDSKLSREHCKIESPDGIAYVFVDLGSSRGSKINKIQITRCELHNGDSIKIGSTKMRFRVAAAKKKGFFN